MGLKSVRKGTNVNEATPVPEKNRRRTGKRTCEPVEQEENHEQAHPGRERSDGKAAWRSIWHLKQRDKIIKN